MKTRNEKCEILKSQGYKYDPNTGKIYGMHGKEIVRLSDQGYINLRYNLRGHHFAWYCVYGNTDFEHLDHINRIKTDNRISNLRKVSHAENQINRLGKGYCWSNEKNKWRASIQTNKVQQHLGYFNTEEEAREAYIKAKVKLLP
jgi:hypothetical protein